MLLLLLLDRYSLAKKNENLDIRKTIWGISYNIKQYKAIFYISLTQLNSYLNCCFLLHFYKVIDLGGEAITSSDYFGNGRVTEFKYGAKLGTVIRKWSGEKMAYLK